MNALDVVLLTTDVPSGENVQILGAVFATACFCKSLPRDFMANLKNWTVGGTLEAYSEMMEQSVSIALAKLQGKAASLGADTVYCMRLATPSIAAGAAEVIAYGTAGKRCR